MATLLLCLALQDDRVTLDLRDVPLREAARQALEPFHHSTEWIREPAASRTVSLKLTWAGYFEVLDTLVDLANLPPAQFHFHPAFSRNAYCGNVDDGVRAVATFDLSPSIRLLVDRQGYAGEPAKIGFWVYSPPGPRPNVRIVDLEINGVPAPEAGVFLGWSGLKNYPVSLMFGGDVPRQSAGEVFHARGMLLFEGRYYPFATGHVVLLPDPFVSDPPAPSSLPLRILLLFGTALGVFLIFGGIRLLLISRRPSGSGS